MSYQPELSDVIAGFAFVFSIATYIIHDRKIKKQERLLNEYQLEKIEEEKRNKRVAQVKANLIKGERGNHVLKIFNAGQGKAERVTISYECNDVYLLNSEIFPYELLNPQEYIDANLVTTYSSPDKLKITLCWDDEFKAGNEFTQFITL